MSLATGSKAASDMQCHFRQLFRLSLAAVLLLMALDVMPGYALIPPPGPSNGSIGLEGVIPGNPPMRGATIAVPANGSVYTSLPITVSGLCPNGTLVKLFSNNIFVGSVICENGSYSLQISLFSGRNDLVARVYDALNQAGPDSNTITVTFIDAQFDQFGTHVVLGSDFARRGTPPGTELEWPIRLSDGNGPYAVSVDWGDGTAADLLSIENPGSLTIKHTYRTAGIYRVIVKATDKNGSTAFLQLTAQATGSIQGTSQKDTHTVVITKTEYWPALAMIPMILVAFWLGRRYELVSLRKHFRGE